MLATSAAPAAATQVRIFRTQTQAAFSAGTLSGVSLDSLGRIELAPRAERLAAITEPFLLSAAPRGADWVVGTGNGGKVLAIDRKGKVSELFAAPEPEIFALWVDPDGTVFAGSSPHGKVYRIPPGAAQAPAKAEVYYDPGETYIWALRRAKDGGLLVATGTQGKLFRVDGKGQGKVIYDSDDTHLRSLDVLPDGDVLIGTAGEGLVLRLGRDGQARTLFDAKEPEVVAITTAPDGNSYVAVVASEASLTELAKPAAAGANAGGAAGGKKGAKGGASGEPTVTVTVEGEGGEAAPAAGRKESGPKSEIFRISKTGVVEKIWTFNEDTVYSLLWQGGSLWVGTGLEGSTATRTARCCSKKTSTSGRSSLSSPGRPARPSPPPTAAPSIGSPPAVRRRAPTRAPPWIPARWPASAPFAGAATLRTGARSASRFGAG